MNDSTFTLIVAALFAVSEALSMIPQVKSNGIFQLIFNMAKRLSGKTALVVLLILAWPLSAFAAPFLVCNPDPGAVYFVITGLPAPLNGSNVPAQADASMKFDVATCPVGGPYTVTVQACDPIWGCSAASSPFVFSRPAALSTPAGLRLGQ